MPAPVSRTSISTLPPRGPAVTWILGQGPTRRLSHLGETWYGTLGDPDTRAIAWMPQADGAGRVLSLGPHLSLSTQPPPFLTLLSRSPLPDVTGPEPVGRGDWGRWVTTLSASHQVDPELTQEILRTDLPLGRGEPHADLRLEDGGQFIEQFIESARPMNLLPLTVARGYLSHFHDVDPEIWRKLEAREEALGRIRNIYLGFFLGLVTLLTWFMRRKRRLDEERNQVLAAYHNPFRQDSPDNPERTPFAAASMVDDILRSLVLNAVVVQGARFTGTSALLNHLVWRLEHRKELDGQPVRVVRLNLEGVPENTFWTRLGEAIVAVYPDHDVSIRIRQMKRLNRGAVEYLLNAVLESSGERIVLVIDNIDTLGLYVQEAQLFRGLIQIVPSCRFTILGAGTDIRQGFAGEPEESPWFNLFQILDLRPMSMEELTHYLDSRLVRPFSYSRDVPATLYELTQARALKVWYLLFTAVEQLLITRKLTLTSQHLRDASRHLQTLATHYDEEEHTQPIVEATSPEEAWAQVVNMVAEARQRRDALQEKLRLRERGQEVHSERGFFHGREV